MATIVINYRYKNYNSWKKNFDASRNRREILGITDVCIGPKTDEPHMACIVLEAELSNIIKGMIIDPQVKLLGQEYGTGYDDILVVDDIESIEYSSLMPEKKVTYSYCAYQPHSVGN